MILIVLMGVFFASLALDEYSDVRHAIQDSSIEACLELETEDYEWDEGQVQHLTQTPFQGEGASPLLENGREALGTGSIPFISDKQKLGLVRRYAPRKGIASHNYTLT